MPLGIGSALWACIIPSETTNLCTNPSFEFGTTGWSAVDSAVIGSASSFQQFGAWSGTVSPGAAGTAGVKSPVWTASNGSLYGVSAYIRGVNGIPYRMVVADSGGLNFVSGGSITFTGGGTWQRYDLSYTEPTGASRTLVIQKNASANVQQYFIDGVQVELGSVTTYIDGDQPGGTWLGAQHNSQSYRSGQYRGGGSVIALADLGLSVDQMPGAGVPPIENSSQSYAITDGAQFQRQRTASRKFTLTAKPIIGTSLADFHITRRTLWDAFKPDLVTPQQPIRFLYVGGQGTQQIDAYYSKGLELGNMDGPIAENAAISFDTYDPYWYTPTQQGTTLPARSALGSTNFMAYRNPLGKWGTLGANGTTVNRSAGGERINDLIFLPGGTLAFGGNFGTLGGGTLYPFLGYYYPASNTFGTPAAGTLTATAGVNALVQIPSGSIFVGGDFVSANGSRTGPIAQLNTTFGTLTGGTTTATVTDLVYTATGTLFASGNMLTTAGTATPTVLQWANGAYGSVGPGTIQGGLQRANVLAYNNVTNVLYVGGDFTQANGTQAVGIVQYAGAWGSMSTGVLSPASAGTIVEALAFGPNLVLYGGGEFGSAGGGSVGNIFAWNGVQFSGLSNGVGSTTTGVFSILPRSDGRIFISGFNWLGSAGGIPIPDDMTIWNGYSYTALDIDFTTNGTIRGVYDTAGTLWLGGGFRGTAQAASVGTIVNTGRAIVYPTLRLRNLSTSGTARIYQLLNTTTSAGLFFNYAMLPGEQAILILQPGSRSFQSSFLGNIYSRILPGSNLAAFNLLSGTNYVSFFSDQDSLEASFFWQPKGWSIDSGTIF